jgi:adenylate cyclase
MHRLFGYTLIFILLIQFFGLFHLVASRSSDFLFSSQEIKTTNISVVEFESTPSEAEINNLLSLINLSKPTAIGIDLKLPFEIVKSLNLVQLSDMHITLPNKDKDGIVRKAACNDSFALAISKLVNNKIKCVDDTININFTLNSDSMDIYKASDILLGQQIPSTAIVLIGLSPSVLNGTYQTPISLNNASDVEIEANLINTLITDTQLITIPIYFSLFISSLFLTIFYLILIRVKFLKGIYVLTLFLISYLSTIWLMYTSNTLQDYFYTPFGLIAIYITQLAYGYFTQSNRRAHVESAFSKYLSKNVLEQLLKHPDSIELGGERKEITLMFVDIKSFSKIAEKKSPAKLAELLNKFLSFVSHEIVKNEGTIDKYVGDQVISFWNAPVDQLKHPILAARTAIEISNGINKIIKSGVGIGLNIGQSFVGNVGSQYLYDYTAIGDNVNITSRLEKLTRVYKVPIITSETFMKAVKLYPEGSEFNFRFIDKLTLKGKTQPINIYEMSKSN